MGQLIQRPPNARATDAENLAQALFFQSRAGRQAALGDGFPDSFVNLLFRKLCFLHLPTPYKLFFSESAAIVVEMPDIVQAIYVFKYC
jgi:hypothetical protein